ncbi:MAG: DMT family transporter [Rhodobacteraceae bacterium]|nr:DMT family transporter [Paracoccaceae bacterium]
MTATNPRLGIFLMVGATLVFAFQDGISRHLAAEYNVMMIVMIRYWFFAGFVVALARIKHGGVRETARTSQPVLQIFRGFLLAAEIVVTVQAFVYLGLIETHAVFASYPLLIAALSGPVLGEIVGWRRWAAIGIGFVGMLVILQPGVRVFSPAALIPLTAAVMFALYGLLTRFAARKDTATTSLFWTGIGGCIVMSVIGPFFWEPMSGPDWWWMALLCITGVLGHYLLIKCYEVAEAGSVQPFAYLQLVFVSVIGLTVFHEDLHKSTALGAGLIVCAGLYTLWRERMRKPR